MGTHPTDLGHSMIAAYYAKALPPILAGEVPSDETPSLRLAVRANENPVAGMVTTDRHRFNNIASKDTSDASLMARSDTATNGNVVVDNTTLDAPAGCDRPDSIVWTVARTGKLSLRLHSVKLWVVFVGGQRFFLLSPPLHHHRMRAHTPVHICPLTAHMHTLNVPRPQILLLEDVLVRTALPLTALQLTRNLSTYHAHRSYH